MIKRHRRTYYEILKDEQDDSHELREKRVTENCLESVARFQRQFPNLFRGA